MELIGRNAKRGGMFPQVALAVALTLAVMAVAGFWEGGCWFTLENAAAASAGKPAYPQKGKPIMIIVPWPAGNANDILGRLLAAEMEKDLGTPVEVVNKPGATTQVGMTQLVRSKPDGYTLAVTSTITTVLTYQDPERKAIFSRADFEPVAGAVAEPTGISCKGDSPYKTLKDLVEAARIAPKKIRIGDSGYMTPSHMASMGLQRAGGVQFSFVHFDSSPLAVAALMGGHVEAAMAGTVATLGAAKSGQIRVLGLTNKIGSHYYPDVKTLSAQGYNVVIEVTRGISAPRGTPKEIVEILSGIVKKATANEEFKKKATAAGLTVHFMDYKEFTAHWNDLDAQVKTMIAEAKAERAPKK